MLGVASAGVPSQTQVALIGKRIATGLAGQVTCRLISLYHYCRDCIIPQPGNASETNGLIVFPGEGSWVGSGHGVAGVKHYTEGGPSMGKKLLVQM